jgi:hypothetical protein
MEQIVFDLKVMGANAERLAVDKAYLRSLCQKEVETFEQYVRSVDGQFRDGLSRFERLAISGYLYQKVRGHIDAFQADNHPSMERKNGEKAG